MHVTIFQAFNFKLKLIGLIHSKKYFFYSFIKEFVKIVRICKNINR